MKLEKDAAPAAADVVVTIGFYDLESTDEDNFVAAGTPLTRSPERAQQLVDLRLAERATPDATPNT